MALRHKARGRPSNNRTLEGLRDLTLALVRERYADFGPTLAAEKLAERDGVKISRETLRKWMVEDGLWLSRSQRRVFHRPRLRRECYGELVQIDGSDHRWFEDRDAPCTLIVAVDDATGAIQEMRFVPSESTFAYFEMLAGYLRSHGKPVALAIVLGPMADNGSIFRQAFGVPGREVRGEDWAWHHAVRSRTSGAKYRDSLCKFKPGQGSGRAEEPHLARPPCQRDAA
jgi:hypothetical protein